MGNPISAKQAHEWEIVDQLIDGDLLTGAIAFARAQAASGKPPRKTREIADRFGDPAANARGAWPSCAKQATKQWRGMQAPFRAIEAVEAAAQLPFEEGCKKEAELFQECLFSTESKGMIHVFFGERTVAKIPDLPKDVKPIDIKTAAVVGAGTMGGGITMTYVNAGIPVVLKEVDQPALDRGLETIRRNYAVSVQRGKMTQAQVDAEAGHDPADARLRRSQRGRHRGRGRLREHGAEEKSLRRNRQGRQAGRHPGLQHVDAQHRRDRRVDIPAADGRRAITSSVRPT